MISEKLWLCDALGQVHVTFERDINFAVRTQKYHPYQAYDRTVKTYFPSVRWPKKAFSTYPDKAINPSKDILNPSNNPKYS